MSRQLGVSNFSPEMVEEMIAIAEAKGFVKPTVYQGQYNLLCRGHEKRLFSILRKHGIAYNAYRSVKPLVKRSCGNRTLIKILQPTRRRLPYRKAYKRGCQ